MKNLFTVKSSDCSIFLSRLQTSKAYIVGSEGIYVSEVVFCDETCISKSCEVEVVTNGQQQITWSQQTSSGNSPDVEASRRRRTAD